MTITPELLVGLGGFVTALLAGATALVAKRGETTARQLKADRDWSDALQRRVIALTRYTFALETACAAAGVPTPDKPADLLGDISGTPRITA